MEKWSRFLILAIIRLSFLLSVFTMILDKTLDVNNIDSSEIYDSSR